MKSKYLLLLIAFFVAANADAQNIFPSTGSAGIGTTTPDASSLLEIRSIEKGILIPRITSEKRDAIAFPATGLLIYQTNNTPGFYYYTGTAWKAITPKAGWLLTGNANTNPVTNFIGTTDAQPLVFKVNNQKAGYLGTSATTNTAFGYGTLSANTSGSSNTAIGFSALSANTSGAYNLANGVQALGSNTAGHHNTANGFWSLVSNTIGYYNTASGSYSLYSNSDGISNTANGISALRFNTHGNDNTATGANTLFNNITGYSNVAVGSNALFHNYSGSNLVAVGDSALYNQYGDGGGNTAVGSKALYSDLKGGYNTANGYNALYTNSDGYNNTANGAYVLYSNSVGHNNTANGYRALFTNATGYYNAATGAFSLENNIDGIGNTADGVSALRNNTSGNDNTAEGANALYNSTTGYSNVAVGSNALFYNATVSNLVALGDSALYNQNGGNGYNTAVGSKALYSNTKGYSNTAIGYQALGSNISGNSNTVIGSRADVSSSGFSNSSALGAKSLITASDQVRIGDATVLSIGGYKAWTNFSDGRVKKNIKENVPGLAFINLLKPITYNLDLDAADKIVQRPVTKDKSGKTIQPSQEEMNARNVQQKVVCTGFIAQDVEATAKKIGYDFDGVDAAKNDKDLYGLRYSEFVVPLVKAVQELSSQNEKLKKQNEEQQNINSDLQTRLAKLEAMMNVHPSTTNLPSASLDQNVPNPFSNTTTISYSLPQSRIGGTSAKIIVIDESGKTIKIFNLSGTGKGSINFSSPFRVGASYQYSLLVDGKLIDTKQMELIK